MCLLKAEGFGEDEEEAPAVLVSSGSELELACVLDTDGLRDGGGDAVANELA